MLTATITCDKCKASTAPPLTSTGRLRVPPGWATIRAPEDEPQPGGDGGGVATLYFDKHLCPGCLSMIPELEAHST